MEPERSHRVVLLTSSREELFDEILRLQKQNEILRQEVERLRGKLETPSKSKKESEKKSSGRSKPPHQWGRKAGHPGCTRPKPDHIDREVEQTLQTCPDCRQTLGAACDEMEHIQEDIVPSRVLVTRYRRKIYWCKNCRHKVDAPYAPDEVPNGYLGPMTLITMAILKYHHGLPGNKIRELLAGMSGLKVTEGAIAQALQRMAHWLNVEADEILKALRQAPHLHMDETGWKVNGVNHWLWTAVNERLAYYRIDRSRGSKVAKDILGESFEGILITDFFSAYNKLSLRQQKCLVHLLRELRECRARDGPQDYVGPYRKLRRIISDAFRLNEKRASMTRLVFRRRVERLKKRLLDFSCAVYTNKDWKRLSGRLLKHQKQILAFLDVPGLPADNNAAERAIRPQVIIRNRSFQNRTQKGAQAQSVLTSLLHTFKLRGENPLPALQRAYLYHRQGNPSRPTLFTPSTFPLG